MTEALLPARLKALDKALKTLVHGQGPLARRNARTRVVDALRGVRQALDVAYPAPPRKVVQRRVRTLGQKRKALINQGYVIVSGYTLSALATVPITMVQTPGGTADTISLKAAQDKHGGAIPGSVYLHAATWAPGWAVHYLGMSLGKVMEAKKNPAMIKAGKAAVRLAGLNIATLPNHIATSVQCVTK